MIWQQRELHINAPLTFRGTTLNFYGIGHIAFHRGNKVKLGKHHKMGLLWQKGQETFTYRPKRNGQNKANSQNVHF